MLGQAQAITLCLCTLLVVPVHNKPTPADETPISSTRCMSFCITPFLSDPTLHRACQDLCDALQAQMDEEPCLQDIANATDEHLALLSFSSGHYIEAAAILSEALNAGGSEALAFLEGFHLDDRGSPAACDAINDAHYCLVQDASTSLSLGLCLPESCDSSSVMNILANVSSVSNGSADFVISKYLGDVHVKAPPTDSASSSRSVTCGDGSRLDTEVGTVLTLIFVGCLAAACVAGTILDRQNHVQNGEQSEGGATTGMGPLVSHEVHPRSVERTLFSSSTVSHAPAQPHDPRENLGFTLGAGWDGTTEIFHDVERRNGKEHEEIARTTLESGGAYLAGDDIRAERLAEETLRRPLLETYLPVPNVHGRKLWRRLEWLGCFSLRKNLRKLLSPPRSTNEEFGALDGIRTLTNIWIIVYHVFMEPLWQGGSLTNRVDVLPSDGHGFFARFSAQPILQGDLGVDTFFFMSAFLAAVGLLPRLQSVPREGIGSWVLERYWHRYVRLMPTALFVTFLTWQVLPLASDGPSWGPVAAQMKDDCRRYWWTQLVFVQDFVPVHMGNSLCVEVSWSLGDEMHFFLVAVPLLVLYHYRPRLSASIVLSIAVGSCFLTFWYAFYEDIRFPTMYTGFTGRSLTARMNVYARPWFRCPTYIIGLLFGMAWHSHLRGLVAAMGSRGKSGGGAAPGDRNASVVRERIFIAVGFTSAALLMLVPVYGAYWGNRDMREAQIPAWSDHLYLAFARPCWALGLVVLCGLCFCGLGGMVNTILTLPVWTPLSQLTYACYLIHIGLIHWLFLPRSVPYRYTSFELTIAVLGVAVAAFGAAAVVHLLVEAPFRNLDSWARRRSPRRRPGSTR